MKISGKYSLLTIVRLKLSKDVRLGKGLKIEIEPGGQLVLGTGVVIRDFVHLRIRRGSKIVLGDGALLDNGVRIIAANQMTVELKNNAKLGYYTVVNGGGGVRVGANTSTYGFCLIQSSRHKVIDGVPSRSEYEHSKVIIEPGCILGLGTILQPGTHLNENTVTSPYTIVEK